MWREKALDVKTEDNLTIVSLVSAHRFKGVDASLRLIRHHLQAFAFGYSHFILLTLHYQPDTCHNLFSVSQTSYNVSNV